MIKARLLSTAAIAVTFGVAAALNAASAQTEKPKPEPAPAAQQHAPPAKIAPSIHAGEEHKAMPETTGQAEKSPVPGHIQAGEKSNTELNASPDRASAADKSSADVKAKPDNAAAKDMSKDTSKNAAKDKDMSKDRAAAQSHETSKSNATTGQGAASAAKLSTEQRTKITTAIKSQHVSPVHLNISVSVGTRVPESVHYYPLPVEVVTVYPEWRGYDYILVGDQIVIIDPGTHEIVAILEA